MRFAVDESRKRIEPFKGGRALCQLCGATLVAKCGEIYTWHWQHKNDGNCDTWKEHETQWHREWKSKFPKENQEIIIEKKGEKHIADILTKEGLIIEFQNSPISTFTITEREEFYKRMVWVVNAEEFKDNFKISSAVKTKLRDVDESKKNNLDSVDYDFKERKEELEKSILNIDKKVEIEESNKFHHISNLKSLKETDKEGLIKEIIVQWQNNQDYWSGHLLDSTDNLQKKFQEKYIKLWEEKKRLQEDKLESENKLNSITEKKTFLFDGIEYKIIFFSEINENNYLKVIASEKATINSLFLNIIKFKTIYDYQQYQYRQNDHSFAIDPETYIEKFNQKIKKATTLLTENSLKLSQVENEIKMELEELFNEQIEKEKKNIKVYEEKIDDLLESKNRLIHKKEINDIHDNNTLNEIKAEIEKTYKNKRFEVMKKNKGLYYFNWKHERKTWLTAWMPIYFDFGDGILFEKIGESQLRKITNEEFLKKYN